MADRVLLVAVHGRQERRGTDRDAVGRIGRHPQRRVAQRSVRAPGVRIDRRRTAHRSRRMGRAGRRQGLRRDAGVIETTVDTGQPPADLAQGARSRRGLQPRQPVPRAARPRSRSRRDADAVRRAARRSGAGRRPAGARHPATAALRPGPCRVPPDRRHLARRRRRRPGGDDPHRASALERFDGRSSFGTWAYRIATNSALDELRKRQRRPQLHVVDERRSATVAGVPVDELAHRQVEAVADRMAIDAASPTSPRSSGPRW